jgi:GNAT superfamily N-acetyltransferase
MGRSRDLGRAPSAAKPGCRRRARCCDVSASRTGCIDDTQAIMALAMELEVVTVPERRDLEDEPAAAFRERWPEFVFHDPVARQYMGRVDDHFAEFAIFLLHQGRVVVGGWGVPFAWDGTPDGLPEGYRTTLVASVEDREASRTANAFSFMVAAAAKDYDKQGLATRVLAALIDRANTAGLSHVLAPIRPTLKHKYPQVSMTSTQPGRDGSPRAAGAPDRCDPGARGRRFRCGRRRRDRGRRVRAYALSTDAQWESGPPGAPACRGAVRRSRVRRLAGDFQAAPGGER